MFEYKFRSGRTLLIEFHKCLLIASTGFYGSKVNEKCLVWPTHYIVGQKDLEITQNPNLEQLWYVVLQMNNVGTMFTHFCNFSCSNIKGFNSNFQTRRLGSQSAPWVQIFGSFSRSWEEGGRVGWGVERVFRLFLCHFTPICSLLFLYFLLNKINNSGKRLLWLVKVFLKKKRSKQS